MSALNAPPLQGSNVIPFPRRASKSVYDFEVADQRPELAVFMAMAQSIPVKDLRVVFRAVTDLAIRDGCPVAASAVGLIGTILAGRKAR